MTLDWLGRHDEAATLFGRVVDMDPNNHYVALIRGWHEMQVGNWAGREGVARTVAGHPALGQLARARLPQGRESAPGRKPETPGRLGTQNGALRRARRRPSPARYSQPRQRYSHVPTTSWKYRSRRLKSCRGRDQVQAAAPFQGTHAFEIAGKRRDLEADLSEHPPRLVPCARRR